MIRSPSVPTPPSLGYRRSGSLLDHKNSQISCLSSVLQQSTKIMLGYSRLRSSFGKIRKSGLNVLPMLSFSQHRLNSRVIEDPKLHEFLDYMDQLKNYERIGVPKDAGTDSDDGFDLGRMRRLLQRLGNPHSRFKAVHVAGTKGKGSTAAFISNILREEGYLVGCYTSPHLLTIRERISLGKRGDPVSVDLLRNLFYQVRGILDLSIEMEGGTLTHFEVFTALAFALFSQQGVDVAVIEAGLGGARDATNVLCSTGLAASVITSIGEEHLSALGGSIESIAMAKSGIIKRGRPVVIGSPLQPHIDHIIRSKASSLDSPVVSASDAGIKSISRFFGREQETPYQCCKIHINVKEDLPLFLDLPDVKLRMLGNHQLQNAVTAACAALCLRNEGWRISDESIRAGLEKTFLPGRGQYLTKKEAEALGLSGASILVDGAHTEASAKGLIEVIKKENPDGPLAFVVSMASDKDLMAFAMQLLAGRKPDVVVLTETSIAGSRSRTASSSNLTDTWSRAAKNLGFSVLELETIEQWRSAGFPELIHGEKANNGSQVLLIALPNALIGDSMKIADELLRYRTERCDLFTGEWVPNPSGPPYSNESCRFIEDPQNCLKNGRPDRNYLYWRWKPYGCSILPFDGEKFLDAMRGKAWALIGDSILRNHVQSLICLLSKAEEAVEVYHDKDYKSRRWHFPSHNFTLSLVWAPFLVKAEIFENDDGQSDSEIQLHLDTLDAKWTDNYRDFDYILISAGQWFLKTAIYWQDRKIVGCHYCPGKNLTELGFEHAYRMSLEKLFHHVLSSDHKPLVIYRTWTPDHFENGEWFSGGTCNRTKPYRMGEFGGRDVDHLMRRIELEEFRKAKARHSGDRIRLELLDTYSLSLQRPDGHPGPYRTFHPFDKEKNGAVQNDCLHWCLPGAIDTWNDLLMEMVLHEIL